MLIIQFSCENSIRFEKLLGKLVENMLAFTSHQVKSSGRGVHVWEHM